MIIQCRPSCKSIHTVEWNKCVPRYDRLGRVIGKEIERQTKQFKTFADANGFAFSLMKKNVKNVNVYSK